MEQTPIGSGISPNRPLTGGAATRTVRLVWQGAALTLCAAVIALIIAVIAVVLPAQSRRVIASGGVERTRQVILAIDGLMASTLDAETGQRGFLLTENLRYLESYDSGVKNIWRQFAILRDLTADDPSQQSQLTVLDGLLHAKLAELAKTIQLARDGDPAAALDIVRSDRGKALMDAIRISVANIVAEENRLLRVRRAVRDNADHVSNEIFITLILLIFATVGILVGGGAAAWAVSITGARRRSAAAIAGRLRLLDMLDLAPVMLRDLDGTVRFWSEGCHRLYGWTAEQAIGQSAHELLHTTFPVSRDVIDAAVLRDGEWSGELYCLTRDGTPVTVLAHEFLEASVEGGRMGVLETVTDLTERKAAQAALHDSEARLRLVQQISGIAFTDRTLPETSALISHEFTRIYGLPPEQTRTPLSAIVALVHPDDREMIAGITADSLERGGRFTAEFRICRPDGTVRWVNLRTEAFRGSDGRPNRIISAQQDITEIVAARDVLAARHDELERSNADLEEFAYTVSHDLRAPLRAIAHLAQWIGDDLKQTATPELTESLDLLQGRVVRMQKLLEGLLEYSRAGQIDKTTENVAISEVVANIVAMQAPPLGFIVTYESDELLLRTQPIAIQVVLENLVSNGLKHHDRTNGRIVVSARRVDRLVEFRVADDGPGIPAEFHQRIFGMFQTLQSRDDREASGIGLAVVKRKVEIHGGRIWIESAPPVRGTAFIFTWKETIPGPTTAIPLVMAEMPSV